MARDEDDGVKEYLDLYKRKVNLFFFVEPGINTEVYREACQMQIPRTGTEVDIIPVSYTHLDVHKRQG